MIRLIACDLDGCTGVDNISNWSIVSAGEKKFSVVATEHGIRLYPRGMAIIFR